LSSITVAGPTGSLAGFGTSSFWNSIFCTQTFFQEILEDGDGQELAGAAPISKTERRKARIVADRMQLAIDNAKNSAECAVRHVGVPPVLDRAPVMARDIA
jgi:hypothetical protein